jgi:NADH-quinone oxidoreductase subunit G
VAAAAPAKPAGAGEALLATWHLQIDAGSLLDADPHLLAEAKAPYALVSPATAAAARIDGSITVSTKRGAITMACHTAPMCDGVVWLPFNSPGSRVLTALGTACGLVHIAPATKEVPA